MQETRLPGKCRKDALYRISESCSLSTVQTGRNPSWSAGAALVARVPDPTAMWSPTDSVGDPASSDGCTPEGMRVRPPRGHACGPCGRITGCCWRAAQQPLAVLRKSLRPIGPLIARHCKGRGFQMMTRPAWGPESAQRSPPRALYTWLWTGSATEI